MVSGREGDAGVGDGKGDGGEGQAGHAEEDVWGQRAGARGVVKG